GELPPDRSFYFRGPEGKLNLRCRNLAFFLEVAAGVDDDTLLYHLRHGDYSRWFRDAISGQYSTDARPTRSLLSRWMANSPGYFARRPRSGPRFRTLAGCIIRTVYGLSCGPRTACAGGPSAASAEGEKPGIAAADATVTGGGDCCFRLRLVCATAVETIQALPFPPSWSAILPLSSNTLALVWT